MVRTALDIGADTFAFFTRNPRGSRAKKEDPGDEALARELLRQGQKPTDICSACGYRDYTTFYRAYTSYFGHSPRQAVGMPLIEERHIIG